MKATLRNRMFKQLCGDTDTNVDGNMNTNGITMDQDNEIQYANILR